MRHRLLIALLIPLVAAACDRATAPQVSAKAEQIEQQLASGDFGQIQGAFADMLLFASTQSMTPYPILASTTGTLSRNGRSETVHASVLERVYLPPAGSSGRPLSRKTVIAWGDFPFLSGRFPRQLVMIADDTVSSLIVPAMRRAHIAAAWSALRDHAGFVINVDPNDRHAWYGTQGSLRISSAEEAGPCPFKTAMDRRRVMDAEVSYDTLGRMDCSSRAYDVSMSAFLTAGDPERISAIESIMKPQSNTIHFSMAQIPGVRLVTQCVMTGERPDESHGCWRALAFWMSNDQFDPSLGVDVAAMKPVFNPNDLTNAMELMQVIDPGSPGTGAILQPPSVTARMANGRVLFRGTRPLNDTTYAVTELVSNAGPARAGRKVRFLTWARRFDPSAPSAQAVIVDVEFPGST